MKTLKLFLVAIIAFTMSSVTTAQTTDHSKMAMTKTETIKVSGN